MITLLRVDHRLLHGQVAFSWTQYVGADCILIANDSVPGDELRKTTIKLAGNDSNLLIVFYVQIMPDDFVMQLHRF